MDPATNASTDRATTDDTIGVLIVDDHDGYRTLAAQVVEASPGFAVVETTVDRQSTLCCLVNRGPEIDLVLMDVHLGDDDGVTLTSEVTASDVDASVVLVTSLDINDLPSDARTCGARGYLPKSQLSPTSLAELVDGAYDWQRGRFERGAGRRP